MTNQPTDDGADRRIALDDCAERWEIREGYLTKLSIEWTPGHTTSSTLTRGELQEIVNAAARQYGIKPECTRPDDDWDPERPIDDTSTSKAPYCTTTKRDGYGEPWACFRRINHEGYCGFQRTSALPEDHPERGRS